MRTLAIILLPRATDLREGLLKLYPSLFLCLWGTKRPGEPAWTFPCNPQAEILSTKLATPKKGTCVRCGTKSRKNRGDERIQDFLFRQRAWCNARHMSHVTSPFQINYSNH